MRHPLSRGAACAAALALLAGCASDGSSAPSASYPSAVATSSGVTGPTSATTRTPAPRPPSAVTVERAPVPGPIGSVVTDGTYIGWSGGDPEGIRDPDFYRWRIGSDDIETMYRNPQRNRGISLPAMDGDRVAFSESGAEDEYVISWNLVYISRPLAKPVILEHARRPMQSPGLVPQPAISGHRLVYALQKIHGRRATSSLVQIDLQTMQRTVLAKSNFDKVEYWYPSLDGDRLVYGTVEYANDKLNGERHVYLLDLATRGAKPRRLDTDGEASQPSIYDDTVVWKSAPRSFNANNWGQVIRYTISTGETERLDYLRERTGYFLVFPRVGPRFVAAEPSDWTKLAVWDLETNAEITVEELSPTGDAGFLRPSLGGQVFVWVAATDFTGSQSQIHFVRLPPPS